MVMPRGEDPVGGKDSKPIKPTIPWRYIAIAAIAAAAIFGFVAASEFFSHNSATTTTTGTGGQPSEYQPANQAPAALISSNKESKKTESTPNPENFNTPYDKGYIDLKEIPIKIPINSFEGQRYCTTNGRPIYLTDFKIDMDNEKITGTIENQEEHSVAIIYPSKIAFKTNIGITLCGPSSQTIKWQGKVTRPDPTKYNRVGPAAVFLGPCEKVSFVLKMEDGYVDYLTSKFSKGSQGEKIGYVKFWKKP